MVKIYHSNTSSRMFISSCPTTCRGSSLGEILSNCLDNVNKIFLQQGGKIFLGTEFRNRWRLTYLTPWPPLVCSTRLLLLPGSMRRMKFKWCLNSFCENKSWFLGHKSKL
jgi:hypothetical protein